MAFNNAVGLMFEIKADSDGATKELDKFLKDVKSKSDDISSSGSNAFNRLAQSVGLSASQTAALSTALPIAGAAIAGVAAAAAGAAVGLFALTKSAADLGSSINDISEKTGLGAETISALKLAADQSGSSLEEVSGSVTKFTRLIGESAKGNEDATATLKALGIDGSKAVNNLDGAFAQAVKRINALPPGVQQVNASIDAFGKSGANVIPVINAMNGNIDEFIKKARELGVILSREDVQAADAFGDQLDVLKAQAGGVAFQFTKGLMPAVTEAMREISRYVTANQETFRQWGESIGKYVRDTVKEFKKTDGTWQEAGALLARNFVGGFATILNKGINDAIKEAAQQSRAGILQFLGRKEIGASDLPDNSDYAPPKVIDYSRPVPKPAPTGGGDESYLTNAKAVEDAKQAAEKAAKEREAIANRNISALISSWQMYAGDINKIFEDSYKSAKEVFEKTGDKDTFKRNLDGLVDYYIENASKADAAIANLENQQAAREKKTAPERDLLQRQQNDRTQKLADKYTAAQAESEKLLTATIKKEADERVKLSEDSASRLIAVNKAELATKLSQVELDRALGLASERDYRKNSDNLKYQSLKYEREINRELLKGGLLSPEKAAEVRQSIKGIDEAIQQGFNEGTIRNVESFSKALSAVDDIFSDLNLSVGDFGKTTGLQDLNKLLADPEVTEAIRKRAESLGWTVEQLKELLRVQQEAADKGQTTGMRPRIVGVEEGEKKEPDLSLGESVLTKIDEAGNRVTKLSNIFGEMKNIAGDAIRSLAAGVGSLVQNFVLLGNAGGQSMRKLVASVLASVAAQAATIAVMELAYGFAALTPWGAAIYGSPTLHFKAAALMGSVAVGAGIAGRLTAGDSFSQGGSASSAFKSQTAPGAIANGGVGGERGSTTGGNYYSGQKERSITDDRITQTEVRHTHEVKLTMDKGVIVQEVSDNVNNRGLLHGLIIKTAEA